MHSNLVVRVASLDVINYSLMWHAGESLLMVYRGLEIE